MIELEKLSGPQDSLKAKVQERFGMLGFGLAFGNFWEDDIFFIHKDQCYLLITVEDMHLGQDFSAKNYINQSKEVYSGVRLEKCTHSAALVQDEIAADMSLRPSIFEQGIARVLEGITGMLTPAPRTGRSSGTIPQLQSIPRGGELTPESFGHRILLHPQAELIFSDRAAEHLAEGPIQIVPDSLMIGDIRIITDENVPPGRFLISGPQGPMYAAMDLAGPDQDENT